MVHSAVKLPGSSRKRAEEIAQQLEREGVPATVRRELGSEIDGACGQLRLRNIGGKITGGSEDFRLP